MQAMIFRREFMKKIVLSAVFAVSVLCADSFKESQAVVTKKYQHSFKAQPAQKDGLKLYSRPSTGSFVLDTVRSGETIEITSCTSNGWCKTKNGSYVHRYLIKDINLASIRPSNISPMQSNTYYNNNEYPVVTFENSSKKDPLDTIIDTSLINKKIDSINTPSQDLVLLELEEIQPISETPLTVRKQKPVQIKQNTQIVFPKRKNIKEKSKENELRLEEQKAKVAKLEPKKAVVYKQLVPDILVKTSNNKEQDISSNFIVSLGGGASFLNYSKNLASSGFSRLALDYLVALGYKAGDYRFLFEYLSSNEDNDYLTRNSYLAKIDYTFYSTPYLDIYLGGNVGFGTQTWDKSPLSVSLGDSSSNSLLYGLYAGQRLKIWPHVELFFEGKLLFSDFNL
jgi:hypothetical protein